MATRSLINLLVSRAMRRDPWIPRVCVVDVNTPIPPGDICDCVHRCKFDPPDADNKEIHIGMYIPEDYGGPEHTEHIWLRRVGGTA